MLVPSSPIEDEVSNSLFGWFHVDIMRSETGIFSYYLNNRLLLNVTDDLHTNGTLLGVGCSSGDAFDNFLIYEYMNTREPIDPFFYRVLDVIVTIVVFGTVVIFLIYLRRLRKG